MPAASYVTARGYKPGVTDQVYDSRAAVLADAAEIIRGEVVALIAEGCPYVQIDNPHYPDYIPDERRAQWEALGVDQDQALSDDIDADNASVSGVDRSATIVAMHLCRGNGAFGAYHTSGGYDRVAEQLFTRLNVDAWLLEYDSERSGGFEPLRFMPKGKTVVLGLVTTKAGELESQDLLLSRIEEAAQVRQHGRSGPEPAVRLLLDAAGQPAGVGGPAPQAGARRGDGPPRLGVGPAATPRRRGW